MSGKHKVNRGDASAAKKVADANPVSFGYQFPAIRGIQAKRAYFVTMCPVRLIPKLFLFSNEELPPELRSQRRLNRSRLPEIVKYVLDNRDSYVMSALTASIDGQVSFKALDTGSENVSLGLLDVSMNSKFIINDGQHRRAALEKVLQQQPDIGDETVAVVCFDDPKLERCQQMFADLNRHAVRPSKSIGILYDHRDVKAVIVRELSRKRSLFATLIEFEKNALSARSKKFLTLSSIYAGTVELLQGIQLQGTAELSNFVVEFWDCIASNLPEWQKVGDGELTSGDVRSRYVHPYSVALQALGRVGNLIYTQQRNWRSWDQSELNSLSSIDWKKTNADWNGRALVGGSMKKGTHNVVLTANLIKQKLGLPLSPEDIRAEEAHAG